MLRYQKNHASVLGGVLGAAIALLVPHRDAGAYEVSTHQILTKRAMDTAQAFKADASVLDDLGFHGDDLFPVAGEQPANVAGLLAYGAKQEDDEQIWRAAFHFMDPQHSGRGLTVPLAHASSSLDWALNDSGIAEFQILVPNLTSENLYSYPDALEQFRAGLTASSEQIRGEQLSLAFQSLGHLVHHVQDLAQPSHARNDSHVAYHNLKFLGLGVDPYHAWTQDRGEDIPTSGYPEPDITRASQLWTDGGKGMAEFTSRNFVSEDTNFWKTPGGFAPHPLFPAPVPLWNPTLKVPMQFPGQVTAEVWFVGNQVTDVLHPDRSSFNDRASSFSIFNEDVGAGHMYLDGTNFDAANAFLLPRAVAYSASFLDHFFRGRMQLASSTFTATSVSLTVRISSKQGLVWRGQPANQSDGIEWSVYYDNVNGARVRVPLTNEDLGNATLSAGDTYEVSFPTPADVDTTKNKPYVLVFNGDIGDERAVAGLAFGPAEASFLLTPDYTPLDSIGGARVVQRQGGVWKVTQQANRVAGNVDWKGRESGEVVSWQGPPSRYFGLGEQTRALYRGGALWTQAPQLVLGAAVSGVTPSKRLIVATKSGGAISIYVRPFAASYPNDNAYDPTTNPLGWRLLQTVFADAISPMFFNASGTEAQAMVWGAERLKLTLNGDVVTSQHISTMGHGTRSGHAYMQQATTTGGHNTCGGTYDGECEGDFKSCPGGFALCAVTRYQASYERHFRMGARTTTVEDDRSVVCVDYRGDEEVLCTFSFEGVNEHALDNLAARDANYSYTEACGGARTYSNGNKGTGSSRHDFGESTVRWLRVGNIEIPLRGYRRSASHVWQTNWFWAGISPAMPRVDYDWSDVTTYYDGTMILFLDARADIALYQSKTTKQSVIARGAATRFDIEFADQGRGSMWSADVTRAELEEQALVALTPQGIVRVPTAASVETQVPQQIGDQLGEDIGRGYSAAACATDPGENYSLPNDPLETVPVQIDDTGFTGNEVLSWPGVGVAVSSSGEALLTAPLLHDEGDGWVENGHWNLLSRGNLSTLIQLAPQGASYAPVGVIR